MTFGRNAFVAGCVLLATAALVQALDSRTATLAAEATDGFVAWTNEAIVPVDAYGSPTTSADGLVFSGGGYSFSATAVVQNFQKWNPDTNVWTPLAPIPDNFNAMGSLVSAGNGKLYLFGGEEVDSGVATNATRIYTIATNTWSAGANMPGSRCFMAAGASGGSIYLAGGYTDGQVTTAQTQLWRYDIATNTFDTSLAAVPAAVGGSGNAILNGILYVVGGRDAANTVVATNYAYNIAGNSWATRASLAVPNNVPGAGIFENHLWIFGGGNPFLASEEAAELPAAPETSATCTAYDPVANTWGTCPSLNVARSFVGGTSIRNMPVAVGGYSGSTTTTAVEANRTDPAIFIDGFESGGTTHWTLAVP